MLLTNVIDHTNLALKRFHKRTEPGLRLKDFCLKLKSVVLEVYGFTKQHVVTRFSIAKQQFPKKNAPNKEHRLQRVYFE